MTRSISKRSALVSKAKDSGTVRPGEAYLRRTRLDRLPELRPHIDVNRVGPAALRTKNLRRQLEAWANTLDPDRIVAGDRYFDFGERLAWSDAGWELEFRSTLLRADARVRPGHCPLGIFGPVEAVWINNDVTLRDALQDEASAYGELDRPLVVDVNSFAISHDDFNTMNALYGTEQISILLEHRDAPPVPSRKPDASWIAGTWADRHVAGVLTGRSIAEYRPTAAPTFWMHPEPHDVVAQLPVRRVAEPIADHIEYGEAETQLHELFDLSAVWPTGEVVPREEIP